MNISTPKPKKNVTWKEPLQSKPKPRKSSKNRQFTPVININSDTDDEDDEKQSAKSKKKKPLTGDGITRNWSKKQEKKFKLYYNQLVESDFDSDAVLGDPPQYFHNWMAVNHPPKDASVDSVTSVATTQSSVDSESQLISNAENASSEENENQESVVESSQQIQLQQNQLPPLEQGDDNEDDNDDDDSGSGGEQNIQNVNENINENVGSSSARRRGRGATTTTRELMKDEILDQQYPIRGIVTTDAICGLISCQIEVDKDNELLWDYLFSKESGITEFIDNSEVARADASKLFVKHLLQFLSESSVQVKSVFPDPIDRKLLHETNSGLIEHILWSFVIPIAVEGTKLYVFLSLSVRIPDH